MTGHVLFIGGVVSTLMVYLIVSVWFQIRLDFSDRYTKSLLFVSQLLVPFSYLVVVLVTIRFDKRIICLLTISLVSIIVLKFEKYRENFKLNTNLKNDDEIEEFRRYLEARNNIRKLFLSFTLQYLLTLSILIISIIGGGQWQEFIGR
ncbi:MAG: hypothetical protein ACRC92_25855 [Peptostreptococcaceae bacterium]